jgi:hypothetical protein
LHGDKTESEKPEKGPAMCETLYSTYNESTKSDRHSFSVYKNKSNVYVVAKGSGTK